MKLLEVLGKLAPAPFSGMFWSTERPPYGRLTDLRRFEPATELVNQRLAHKPRPARSTYEGIEDQLVNGALLQEYGTVTAHRTVGSQFERAR
jgi:hypothetical protein